MLFYDLNVKRPQAPEELKEVLKACFTVGYKVVAVNTNIDDSFFNAKDRRGKKAPKIEEVPPPVDLEKYQDIPVKIINRLNISLENVATTHQVQQNKTVKQYDVISYLPTSTQVLKALKDVPDFDILSYNPTIDNPPLLYNRKLYNQFVQKGVYFELPYGPAIADASHRKYIIYTSSMYHALGKSNNIIVTSAADRPQLIRGPYDVINLCVLFGLNQEQAKNSVTRNCEDLLRRARTRRRGKWTVEMTIEDESECLTETDEFETVIQSSSMEEDALCPPSLGTSMENMESETETYRTIDLVEVD